MVKKKKKKSPCQCSWCAFNPGLGRSLVEEMATHSSILAWRIPRTEEPGGLPSMGPQELDTHTHTHLPSASARIKLWAAAPADLQHLKGVQGGEQKWGTLCSGKLAKQVRYFQELILGAQFMHLISRKALNSITVMSTPHDFITFMRLAETFCKKIYAWLHVLPLHWNEIYWPSPYLLGAVSQCYLKCCLPGYSPHFVPS